MSVASATYKRALKRKKEGWPLAGRDMLAARTHYVDAAVAASREGSRRATRTLNKRTRRSVRDSTHKSPARIRSGMTALGKTARRRKRV